MQILDQPHKHKEIMVHTKVRGQCINLIRASPICLSNLCRILFDNSILQTFDGYKESIIQLYCYTMGKAKQDKLNCYKTNDYMFVRYQK